MKKIALIFSLICMSPGVWAQTYECDTTSFGTGGWIGEKMFVFLDTKEQKAELVDWTIHRVFGDKIPVDLRKLSDTKYLLSWKLNSFRTSNDATTKISYKVRLNTARPTFTISGHLHGYDNVISGSGRCKIRK